MSTTSYVSLDADAPPARVCLVAAENDALPGAKVGGIGDVLRDVPGALAQAGASVSVILPSYGTLHTLPGSRLVGVLTVRFGRSTRQVEVYAMPDPGASGVTLRILHHADMAPCGDGRVYCDDPPDAPFATDATKYALFCAAVLEAFESELEPAPDVLHLHDWHAGLIAVLREFDPRFKVARRARLVYSIHNLALQGVRPFDGHPSSLARWYPWLPLDAELHAATADPRWSDCANPMAAGIRLADRVHAVSPNYADEVVLPDAPERGFHGGEGLERDLAVARRQGRLIGILNGIVYPAGNQGHAAREEDGIEWRRWMRRIAAGLLRGLANDGALRAVDYLAHQRALDWTTGSRPVHVLTSVGRLVAQKAALLLEPMADGRPALVHLLERRRADTALLLIGSGDPALERAMQAIAARHDNFLFINRYAAELAESLYSFGDLFLMPSSFEPCGISQMLAMRAGQPCLVHAVGGLVDTVEDGVDGFHFTGDSRRAQAQAMLERIDDALALRARDPDRWAELAATAHSRRFGWDDAARRYLKDLYTS